MNVSSLPLNSSLSSPAVAPTNPTNPLSDPDGDDSARVHRGGHHHHGGGGGAFGSAVASALQSLGLQLPSSQSDGTQSDAADTSSDSSSGSGPSRIGGDMRNMMQALFEAVRGEQGGGQSSPAVSSATSSSRPSPFANGLSALITQVGNGSAPAALQSAFNQVAQDLGGASASGGSASGSFAASASLQNFLTALQGNLGYSAASSPGSGNLLTTQV